MNTKTDRVAELTSALSQSEVDLAATREALGIAIADGDERAAKNAREDVARAERLASELRSALPVAERRAREAQAAEAERQQRVREKAANVVRKARIVAAKRVDVALLSLGKAYQDYLATATGGTPEDAGRAARRNRSAIAAATLAHAPEFALALEVRRVPAMHRQSLEASQSITEFPE